MKKIVVRKLEKTETTNIAGGADRQAQPEGDDRRLGVAADHWKETLAADRVG